MDSMKKIGIKTTLKHLNEPYSKWEFLIKINRNLDDIINFACRSPNKNFIGSLAFKLNSLLLKSILYEDYSVFKIIINIFTIIYYHSLLMGVN